MVMADILHSCTDPGIAEAAIVSIGGSFALRMRAEAGRLGLPLGVFTASLVARFAVDATERDWRDLAAAVARADQPVLSGLQSMAERMLAARQQTPYRLPRHETRPVARAHAVSANAAQRCTL